MRVTRLMYDAVTPANIPTDAQLVAGYVDGRYAWHPEDWARFPGAVHVPIACFASTDAGVVLDVEPGDATPAQAPGWVQRRRAAGVDPTVYCSLASWPAVRAAFAAARVAEPHWWIAAYPGIGPQLYPGTVAHQYADPGPYDLSVVADYWPGVDGPVPVTNTIATTPGLPVAPGTLTTTPPAPAPEDIVATLDDLSALLDSKLATVTANLVTASARDQRRWLKFEGSNLAWIDLGTCRRRGTWAQYAADGQPGIGVLQVTDPFWSLPIVGDAWGELYRRTGQAAAWLLEVEPSTGTAVRRWPDRQPYLDHGAPPIVDLPPTHPFWSLPTIGTLPPEGA